ncbi:hypothetical protein [Salmonella enterica]|uniref:hypothetical protein n=1 Tax=Salmonella enterica TaxID=28901 RepID=UPI0039EC896A
MEAICLNLNYWRRILLEKAEAEEQLRQENDKKLLGQVLEIYDQKYVAELLRKVGKNEWSRETLNRCD